MQNILVHMYEAGLHSLEEVMRASSQNTERLQQQNFQAVHNALEENSRSIAQLREAGNLQQIMAINSGLMAAQLDRMTQYWSGLWGVAGAAQKSMIEHAQSQMDQPTESMRRDFPIAEGASEDATELATAHISAAVAEAREAAAPSRKTQEQRKRA